METRVSHREVRSVRDFFLEIVMIVVGVLIALAVDQLRATVHEHHLANEARENFRREVDLEKRALTMYLTKVSQSQSALQKIVDDPAASSQSDLKIPDSLIWQFLPVNAWDSAQATQAFSYMEPAEVQRYALIHTGQLLFNDFEQKQHDLLMDLYSYSGRKDLSRDEINARNRDIRRIQNYLVSIDQISQELLRDFDSSPEAVAKIGL